MQSGSGARRAVCGGLGGGSVSIPQGACGRAPGPSPPSRLQKSISQPLTLFLHLEGSERLTVSRLPGQADDMQALQSASGISSSRVSVCPSVSPHVSTSSRPCLCARCAKQAGDTAGSPLGADRHKWPERSLTLARC